jgi:hypothetical protein
MSAGPVIRIALAGLLLATLTLAAPPQSGGFTGLERLAGFQRVSESSCGGKLAGAEPDFEARIPAAPGAPEIVFRQWLNREHPRITTQHWALFEGGREVDCWFFTPAPDANPERKALAPYEVTEVVAGSGNAVTFRTVGAMHRPGGRGWMQGKDFVFSLAAGPVGIRLKLEYVVSRYFFSYGETVGVNRERVVRREGAEVIEVRVRDRVSASEMQRCGLELPESSELDEREYQRALENGVDCLVNRPGVKLRYRRLEEPSFIEISGKQRVPQ